jgi:hypothetical protein
LNKSQYQTESLEFYRRLGNFTDMVTILIKHRLPKRAISWRSEFAEKSAALLITRLNERVFRRKYLSGEKSLSTLISYEVGRKLGRPHFHLVIERPDNLTRENFIAVLRKVVVSMEWLIDDFDVRDYKNSGCVGYICKGNFDSFILSGCNIKK